MRTESSTNKTGYPFIRVRSENTTHADVRPMRPQERTAEMKRKSEVLYLQPGDQARLTVQGGARETRD
jgi:hypothetical protein